MWRFAGVCGLAGLLIAGVAAWRTPGQYQSVAVLRMAPAPAEERVEKLNQAEQTILSRRSLATVIQKYELYQEERKHTPLEDVVQNLRESPDSDPNAGHAKFAGPEPGLFDCVQR